MPDQRCPGDRQVRHADGSGNDMIEDCALRLGSEEAGIVGKKMRIQILQDGRQIDAVVFRAGMVTLDQDGENGQEQQWEQSPEPASVYVGYRSGFGGTNPANRWDRVLRRFRSGVESAGGLLNSCEQIRGQNSHAALKG